MTTLKGMTWRHPRGFDPMVATSKVWREKTGVEIIWEQRSLQDFESYPVEKLAQDYDLMVIDHPHVGQIYREDCLLPLDQPGREAELAELAAHSVGQSFPSYTWEGRQWALPIDAATQVQAHRPDLLTSQAKTWDAVMEHAREGRVLLPMRAPHALMCFYTLTANLGAPCATSGETLVDAAIGARVLTMLAELMRHVRPQAWEMDPIAVLDALAEGTAPEALVPFTYGYLSYATDDFRPHRIAFTDIPVAGTEGPVGSALGGTGIAVSARSAHQQAALDYAFWVAGGEIQRTLFAAAGGQPGHALAWEDDAVNAPVHNFYRDTRATLEGAWVRPRFDGYMGFQKRGSEILEEGLRSGRTAAAIVADLNAAFREASSGR